MGQTLLRKVWDLHTVRQLPTGQTQLFIGLHLIHEVTTPQAFDALRANGWKVAFPERTFATVDHIIPTRERQRPFLDVMAEDMMSSLERNCRDFGAAAGRARRRPAGHRARDRAGTGADPAGHDHRLRRQPHLHARRVRLGGLRHRHLAGARRAGLAVPGDRAAEGAPHPRHRHAARAASTPRTSSSTIIQRLGVRGGTGYAYEYAGDAVDRMSMDERMTMCNMSIEGGARVGYVNPDATTVDYLRGRPFAPAGRLVRRDGAVVAVDGLGRRRRLRRRGGDSRRRADAGGDLGRPPRPVDRRGRSACRRQPSPGQMPQPPPTRWTTWASRRASRSPA